MVREQQKCLDTGSDDFIAKPILPRQLLAVLEKMCKVFVDKSINC